MSLGRLWLLGALCVGLTAASPGAAVAGTRTWSVMPTPANDQVSLFAVSCFAENNCIALGAYGFAAGPGTPSAEHWNGTRWSAVAAPADGMSLNAVACPSASFCIAVGENYSNLAQAWSWNGTAWTDQATYLHRAPSSVLYAIECAGASSCEAVGSYSDANTYPLAESWNGTTWSGQSTHGAPTGSLYGVSCVTVGHCEAAGSVTMPKSEPTLAMGLSGGSTWVTQTTPGVQGYFLAVSCYANGCTAIGLTEYNKTLAEAWNGSAWTLQSPVGSGEPSGTSLIGWRAIHCASSSSCTVAGYWSGTGTAEPLIDTWNGNKWSVNRTPATHARLWALSCTSNGSVCTAVGETDLAKTNNSFAMRN